MKLSEAMRLGGAASEQGFYGLIDAAGKTCALGSAGMAIGINLRNNDGTPYYELESNFPILSTKTDCPIEDCFENCNPPISLECTPLTSLSWCIMHLNDDHRWTREQIADFVATIENKPVSEEIEVATTV